MRCQEWFDGHNPTYEEQQEQERKLLNVPLADLVIVAGPPGTIGRKLYNELFDASNAKPILCGEHGKAIRSHALTAGRTSIARACGSALRAAKRPAASERII
jgi:hypothetical protein